MKRSNLILISFLLMLYIAPMVFIAGYASPTDAHMTKDFSIASDWYNESLYRKSVSINGSVGAGTNYQVRIPVTYDIHMQTDFDDIRFTDNDEITLLDYWRESYTASTSAVFWVEVSDDLGSNQIIYMYYGNSTSTSLSNGTATFLVYEDWSSESIRTDVWDIVTSDGGVSYSSAGATHGTIAKFDANAGASYKITSDYDTASPTAVMFRSNIEEAGIDNVGRQGSGYDGAFSFALIQTTDTSERFYVYDDDANHDNQLMDIAYFDTWVTFQITRDGTNAKLYADTILIETASCEPDIITTNPATSIMVGDSEDDINSDWVAVRKFIADEPVFDSFGNEESNVYWYLIDTAILKFNVAFFMGSLDALMTFLGLIMIPASTLFLAYSSKHDMSSDKVFFFLILFVIGWALFISGIAP